jgi:chromosome segregation ATPase
MWKTKSEHDALEFEEQVKALEDELEREKEKVKKMQFELAQKMQELHTVKDQQNQATNGLKEQVKERDAQIAKLKRQITVKGTASLVPVLCAVCVCVCVLCALLTPLQPEFRHPIAVEFSGRAGE